MKPVARYLLVFTIPLLASLLLFYGSLSLRLEAHRISNEWLNLALSSNDWDKEAAFAAIRNHEQIRVFNRIDSLAIFTVLFASFVSALIVPPNLSSERKLNLLMVLAVGFCAAQFVIGFGFLNWLGFGKVALAGSVLAGSVVWLRSAIVHKQNR